MDAKLCRAAYDRVLYVLYSIGIIGSKPNAMTCKILTSRSVY